MKLTGRNGGFSVVLLVLVAFQVAMGQQRVSTKYERGALAANGLPVGVWEYYDSRGELELKMNYDSSRIVCRRPDTLRYPLRVNGVWKIARPMRPPLLLGSRTELVTRLQQSLRYPFQALRYRRSGRVVLTFEVNERGEVLPPETAETADAALSEEVSRTAAPLTMRWLPALYQGRPVSARISFVATFKIVTEAEQNAVRAADKFRRQNKGIAAADSARTRTAALPYLPGALNEIIVVALTAN